MMRLFRHTLSFLLLIALVMPVHTEIRPLCAETMIRIIGDKTPQAPDSSSNRNLSESPASSDNRGTTIRIMGDKQGQSMAVTGGRQSPSERNESASPARELRIIGDKSEAVRNSEPAQPPVSGIAAKKPENETARESENIAETVEKQARQQAAQKAEEERKAAEKAEQERQAKSRIDEERKAAEEAEQEYQARLRTVREKAEAEAARQAALLQEQKQLAARKAEEERKAAEVAELEHRARIKAAREKAEAEEARQISLLLEQKLLAARRAEELRKAAEKAEQDRIEALKADEERLTAARKALAKKLMLETDTLVQKTEVTGTATALPSTTNDGSATNIDRENGADNRAAPLPVSIWDLYLSAKSNDPALGRTEARVTGSKADSDLLFSGLMPHLDSSAGIKQISQALSNYNTASNTNSDYSSLNYNVTARLTLLHVPTLYSLSAAAAALKVEQAGVAAARQNLIVKLTDAYFNLLRAQTDKQIAIGEINRLKQVLDQSQAFLKAGTGDVIAVYEAQSRLDGANADLTKSESNLRLAEQKLSSLTGKQVNSVVNYLPQIPTGPDPDDLDWWVATMEKEQPLIRQAREGLKQTSEQRKAAKAEYLPILQASGGYDVNRGTADQPSAEVRQWFIGASISLPLYSGGETSAKVRRAVATEEERQHMFDETMDQQRESVKQAFFNLRYNISLIKALDQKKTSAEIQLAAVKKGRKIGTRNAIDVLNAEQSYSIALRDHRYALYENITRVIQLKSAAGILSETDISGLSLIESPALENGLGMLISRVSAK